MARLKLNPELLKKVNDSQSMMLRVPDDAVIKGVGDNASYTWVEKFNIVGSTVGPDKNDASRDLYTIQLQVPKDSPFPTNIGKTFTLWYRVSNAALEAGDANEGAFKMSIISIGKLIGILSALGHQVGEDDDLEPLFKSNGPAEPAPIVGNQLVARIVDKLGKDKDKNPVRVQDVSKFMSLETAGIE